MRNFITSIGGRKVVGFILCLASVGALAYTDHLSETAADTVVWLFTALIGGNGISALAAAWGAKKVTAPAAAEETDE